MQENRKADLKFSFLFSGELEREEGRGEKDKRGKEGLVHVTIPLMKVCFLVKDICSAFKSVEGLMIRRS